MRPIMNRAGIFTLFLILIFAWPVWGATYYVKSGGNDRLDGRSDSTAWATIAKVQATVTSGDTVYFRSQDTWTGTRPVLTATAGVTYDGSTYGSGTRATLRAANDGQGTTGMAVKIYTSNVTFKGFNINLNGKKGGGIYVGMYATSDISNVIIDNCIVHDSNLDEQQYEYGIHVGNREQHTITNTTITNSTVYNFYGEGIALYQGWNYPTNRSDTILVRNCTSYNNGLGLLIANDSDNVTVEYCNLYNNRTYGLWIRTSIHSDGDYYTVMSGPNNFAIRYNLLYGNHRAGISIVNPRYSPEGATVSGSIHNNILYENGFASATNPQNCDGANLWISGNSGTNGSDYPGSTINIYNNTFYSTLNDCLNSNSSVSIGWWGKITGGTFNLKNNIIYSSSYYAIKASFEGAASFNHSNNLVYRSSGSSGLHIYDSGTTYDRTAVKTWEATAKNTDPSFTGGTLPTGFTGTYGVNMVPNRAYFAISSGDAIKNGAILGSPYNSCINGAGLATPITRPQGSAYDIGAYEYIGPLAPTNLRLFK